MKSVSLIIIFFLFFLNLYSGKKYIVGVENINYYPHYKGDNSNYSGYGREVLDLFAKEKGYIFEYKPLPVIRLHFEFLNEKLDFKYPDNPYWNEEMKKKKGKEIFYSSSVARYVDGVCVLPENKGKGISNLKRLGIVRGFTPYLYMEYINSGKIDLVSNVSFINMLKQSLDKRSDGVYGNVAVIKYQLKEVLKKEDAMVFDERLPYLEDGYFLSSIKYRSIIDEFNLFLKENKEKIDILKEKYQIKKIK